MHLGLPILAGLDTADPSDSLEIDQRPSFDACTTTGTSTHYLSELSSRLHFVSSPFIEKKNEEWLYRSRCSHVIGSVALQSVYLLFFTRGHYREDSFKGEMAAELVGSLIIFLPLFLMGA